MGFFDDLESKVGRVPAPDQAPPTEPALAAAIARLEAGWVFEGLLSPPLPLRQGMDDEAVEHRVRVAAAGGRFTLVHALTQSRYAKTRPKRPPPDRTVDREGLVQALRDDPLLARRLVEAATGRDPMTDPTNEPDR